jgi:hypothetical protein
VAEFAFSAAVAAWPSGLGRGLQSPVPRFESGRRLQLGLTPRKPARSSGAAVDMAIVSVDLMSDRVVGTGFSGPNGAVCNRMDPIPVNKQLQGRYPSQ